MQRLVFSIVILTLAGCGAVDNDLSNTFVYNESDGVSGLDPAFATQLEDMWVCNQIFDGLVALDTDLNIVPCIARSWETDSSGLVYTFHLRSDVWFHQLADMPFEPRTVRASDFVFSFERILSSELASPGKWIFSEASSSGTPFEAVDDSTLVIRLRKPFGQFVGILTTQYGNVVMPEAVRHFGPDFRFHPVGTGPFRFAFWEPGVALVLHRHPRYWMRDEAGNELPYLDAVKVEFAGDVSTEYYGLLSGRYDFISGIHPSFKDELLDANGELSVDFADKLVLQHRPFIKTDYIGFHIDPAAPGMEGHPLLDARIRRALDLAIDKKKMARFLRNNAVYPGNEGFVPRGLPMSRITDDRATGLAEAKRLLAETGFEGGKGFPEIAIAATADNSDILEFVQHQWAMLGITCKIDIMPAPTLREMVAKGGVKIFKRSWLADYADAENFFALFYSPNFAPNGPNYMHYSNPDFDRLYESVRGQSDPARRLPAYRQMDSLLRMETPVIPLFYDRVTHFLQKNISGFETNPVNMLELTRVRKSAP